MLNCFIWKWIEKRKTTLQERWFWKLAFPKEFRFFLLEMKWFFRAKRQTILFFEEKKRGLLLKTLLIIYLTNLCAAKLVRINVRYALAIFQTDLSSNVDAMKTIGMHKIAESISNGTTCWRKIAHVDLLMMFDWKLRVSVVKNRIQTFNSECSTLCPIKLGQTCECCHLDSIQNNIYISNMSESLSTAIFTWWYFSRKTLYWNALFER